MTSTTKPLTKVEVSLSFPVPVKDAEGKLASRGTLTLHRPKTRHVKRLAGLVGAELLDALVGAEGGLEKFRGDKEAKEAAATKLVIDMGKLLLAPKNLDEVTDILASMCDEKPELIDELDPVDLFSLVMGLASFFPTLTSALSSSGPAN